ncbi:MAG: hypothetical protein COU29_02705 [Candidatus Magasanikbacteria bacterium CG10_big_fil_rev_8_21_14_0_10_36_32]|uniref:LytR/CpsA/Psr regulator C-terminal domain-containing protein n=1 Tax=Candidatus Magasanikbacteria bacterium CG10_big_fil_rev_8_21_14_0_10_36_32 TaxID=1974646 RepID=A0A2M6W7A8_9BACT|nr:MAG: hypothetical protein COU29_02705 [Candidatus Magasanikbacteria bacterium CG10_big_fil_rev_8_21_14_0_10_36_32]
MEQPALSQNKKIKTDDFQVTILPSIAYGRPRLKRVLLFLLSNAAARLLIVLLLGVAIVFVWSWLNYKYAEKELEIQQANLSPQAQVIQKETGNLLERLGRHMFLPVDEKPVVASIVDAKVLAQSNAFYKNAQNGDKIIVYVNSQLAIIYNPIADKIVNVGPLIDEEVIQEVLVVEIRNGTKISGLAEKLSGQLKIDSSFDVLSISYAEKRNYQKNILIDLSGGSKKDLIKKLESILGVSAVTTTPVGEKNSKAEAVIILGNK